MTEDVIIKDMTKQEAEEARDFINGHGNELRLRVLDMYTRNGHKALGYETWRECAQKEFTMGQTLVYYHLNAAQIEQGIAALPDTEPEFRDVVKELPESLFRPLKSLGDGSSLEQRAALQLAFAAAKECIADGQPTAALIEESAAQIAAMKDGDGPVNYDGKMMAATSLVIHSWTARQQAAIERRNNMNGKQPPPKQDQQEVLVNMLLRYCNVRIVSVAGKQVTFLFDNVNDVKKVAQAWRDNPTNLKLDLYSDKE